MQNEETELPVHAPTDVPDSQTILLNLFQTYEPIFDAHLWPREEARWHELVFSLLAAIGDPEILPETLRSLTETLAKWKLVEVSVLAKIYNGGTAAQGDPLAVTIRTLLHKIGFTPTAADRALMALCGAAAGIQSHFDGKVQRYFRQYGMQMLEEAGRYFNLNGLDEITGRRALSIWLQNTLNMPVPVFDSITAGACQVLGVPQNDLIKEADAADINVALLDETLRAYWTDEVEKLEGEAHEIKD